MVSSRTLTAFWQDTRGVTLVDGLITFPLVILVFAAFIEFGYAMFQWNQTVKALQYGARLAAVSDPLTTNFNTVFPKSTNNPLDVGTSTPNNAAISSTCGPERINCNLTALNRIVLGNDGTCRAGGGSPPGICDINWRIEPRNLVVTYQRSGLGYWGRPDGPVLTMRLEIRDVFLELPILGALLGFDNIPVPAHPVTITTEDLKTCSTC